MANQVVDTLRAPAVASPTFREGGPPPPAMRLALTAVSCFGLSLTQGAIPTALDGDVRGTMENTATKTWPCDPGFSPDEPTVATRREIAGTGFRTQWTGHFLICYDTSDDVLQPLIARLEGTFDSILQYCKRIGLEITLPAQPLNVLLFDKPEDFNRFCRARRMEVAGVAGIYDPNSNLAVFANALNRTDVRKITARIGELQGTLRELREDPPQSVTVEQRRKALTRKLNLLRVRREVLVDKANRLVLQHEIAHQVLFNIGIHARGADNPVWLLEGLACQFEMVRCILIHHPPGSVHQGQVNQDAAYQPVRINHERLGDLREALGLTPDTRRVTDRQYSEAVAAGRLAPLVSLVTEPKALSATSANGAFRYAQAWALVYYLQQHHSEAFTAYLRGLAKRIPHVVASPKQERERFESLFGPLDDRFRRNWLNTMARLPLDRREAGW